MNDKELTQLITELSSSAGVSGCESETAVSGDIVTLSPASASFDRYRNFEERGRCYKAIVNAL
ncbi:MAG: hypothetical protein LIO69_08205 [Oscillospiraceae bacterium]|nr:hypothetical protein [Oscillospiraceae bacterium]